MTDFSNCDFDKYSKHIENHGLKQTWIDICDFVSSNGETPFLCIKNFGELYEIGLAIENKEMKRSSGKYFTPKDISLLMSQMLEECPGYNVCDIGCGTGNLILSYLAYIGKDRAIDMIRAGRIYVYDIDETALLICKTSIGLLYGKDNAKHVHFIEGDFLDNDIEIPENSKSISNPPYAAIKEEGARWNITKNIEESNEFYSAFMEKTIEQSIGAVIISPFSFVSGNKFYSLRSIMCERGYGYIFSFDNVPENIFGRKHGIFNTNHANSVRPSITEFISDKEIHGYKVSPLIRFKHDEREKVINLNFLKSRLPEVYQIVTPNEKYFKKIEKSLSNVYKVWIEKSDGKLVDLCTDTGQYDLYVPNTCRYFTTCSIKKLRRSGQIELHFDDYEKFCYAFCLVNSSFCYWWWRIYDGAITYSKSLLMNMPTFYGLLSHDDKKFFINITKTMIQISSNYLTTKNNVGIQENIKYPDEYRSTINKKMLEVLDRNLSNIKFDVIHANCIGD